MKTKKTQTKSERKIIKKKELINPILDNRVVSDITFATRFAEFLKGCRPLNQIDEEELEYLKSVAGKLLTYQVATLEDNNEKDYFRNLGYKI